jgi:hypothetical protein
VHAQGTAQSLPAVPWTPAFCKHPRNRGCPPFQRAAAGPSVGRTFCNASQPLLQAPKLSALKAMPFR